MATPNITSISPNQASAGNQVTISGSGFTGTSAVNFGAVGATPFTVNSDTQITVTVPTMPADTQFPDATTVQVIVPGQPTSNVSPFTIVQTNIPSGGLLNSITLQNNSGLDPTQYTVWVAGFIEQQDADKNAYYIFLQGDGTFAEAAGETATFINVNQGMTVNVPNVPNYGNNRLTITITEAGTVPAALSPVTGYTAYPFKVVPSVCPPGPYDIFEFGPNAQYDVSAVDAFGINLSFTVNNDPLTYGTNPSVTRKQIGDAFSSFVLNDPLGSGYVQLLYTNPVGKDYPTVVEGQFSAIVSPKDWLAIYPDAAGLVNYWDATVNAFFASGNQISLFLNAATVDTYSGISDGTQYTLKGAASGVQVTIPASDFTGNQGFIQAVRGIGITNPTPQQQSEYDVFSQMEAAIFEALSRGVALDGVVPSNKTIAENYTSDAWTNLANWYTNHNNAYNNQPSVYDVYAKFFHYGTIGSNPAQNVFGLNTGKTFGMVYGFSLDENPNVGSWSKNNNVPSKTDYNVGAGQDVVLTIGGWG
jgi:hypothetical protein